MIEFFETYKSELLYALLVVGALFVLRFFTNYAYKVIIKKNQEKLSDYTSWRILKRIVNTIWLVLAIMTISSLFFIEFYEKLQSNFRFLLYMGLVAVITIVVASFINIWFRKKIEYKIENKEDPTVFKFLRYIVVVLVYIVGFMFVLMVFPAFKGIAQTALGGAGIIALIAGVASQEALSNLVGGVFIISFKPFKIGDVIKLSDSMVGTVVDITLRHTVLRNAENKMIVIPNAIINKEKLINYNLNDLKICDRIEIGISYDSDIDLAKKIMKEEAENHPLVIDNRTASDILDGKPKVKVAVISLDDSSVRIRAWVWATNNSQSFEIRFDLLESIKKRFDNEGIEIPFPHRTLVFKNTDDQTTT